MEEIILTKNCVALIDKENAIDINQHKWYAVNKGKVSDLYYAATIINKKSISMHRYILKIKDKTIKIDHIDGNGLNNQKSNLRLCKLSENLKNRRIPSNNKTGYKGVSFKKKLNKYRSSIGYSSKSIHLGYYENSIEAAEAYNKKAKELFGEYARLNVF
jgi:hypothetical protein